jgi:hypothetical protein
MIKTTTAPHSDNMIHKQCLGTSIIIRTDAKTISHKTLYVQLNKK